MLLCYHSLVKRKRKSWTILAVIGGMVVVGAVVASFRSAKNQVILTRAEPEAEAGAVLAPMDIQAELDNPDVQKIQIKDNNGTLMAAVFDVNSPETPRQGTIEVVHLSNDVNVRSAATGLELEHGNVKSVTSFPISYNKVTNQIVIEASGGPHYLRILPDRAMEIGKKEINGEVTAMEIVGVQKSAAGDNLAFKISGQKSRYVAGLFPVETTVETAVGAQSGVILETMEPWWFKFLP